MEPDQKSPASLDSPQFTSVGSRAWPYYSGWQQQVLTCRKCGWTGKVSAKDFGDVSDVAATIECPKCYGSLGVVMFPNRRFTEEAAARGNEEAIAAMRGFRAREDHNRKLLERFAREKMHCADQLPELAGESLAFVWDFVKGSDGEYYNLIKLSDVELWRELAFFGHVRRFEEMKELLKQKYGPRFQSLTPTSASIEWLTGDNLRVALRLSYR